MKYKCPTVGCGASAKKRACARAAWRRALQLSAGTLPPPGTRSHLLIFLWEGEARLARKLVPLQLSPKFPHFASGRGRGMAKGRGTGRWIFQVTPGAKWTTEPHSEQWVCLERLVRN